jgi:integrase
VKTDVSRGAYWDPSRSRITVARFADEWLDGAMNLGDGGRETYRRDLDRYILPELGAYRLGSLTVTAIDDYLSGELEDLAASSVHRHYRTIRRMCEVAVIKGRLQKNPCNAVSPPKADHAEMRFLSVDQVLALADVISPGRGWRSKSGTGKDRPGRYRAWVLLAAFGGPRWSEMVGLRRSAVKGAQVRIVEQLVRRDDGEWHRYKPKTKAGRRVIRLPALVADELAVHLDEWAAEGPDGLVFPNRLGSPLNGPSFTGNVWKPGLLRAGLDPKIRIHDLRHTAVALAIQVGAHPKAIQMRMGHASITTTLDRYGHLFPEMDGEIATGLDGLVAAATATEASRSAA